MIPLCKISFGPEEMRAIKEVFSTGWLAHGEKNKEFEDNFARVIGTKYAVSVNSCTSAIFLILKALDIKGEVIIPSFTFSATANAVVSAGAKPVYADIIWKTGNIDPHDIENKITPETEAVIPVHFAGQSCKIDRIKNIADKYGLALIEDSAEAIGALFKNQCAGSFGIGCFSFFPTKNITTGEGGMITTDDKNLADKVRILSSHGISKHRRAGKNFWNRSSEIPGYNMRMSNILAAVGVEQLKKLKVFNSLRIQHASYFNTQLKDYVEIPLEDNGCRHVYQMYTIRVSSNRDKIIHRLRSMNIEASVHFDPPVHQQEYYKSTKTAGSLPVTERLSKSIITLPMFPDLKQDELKYITGALMEILNEDQLT